MFEVGKRYIAKSGNRVARVTCIKRSASHVTFSVSGCDARRMGTRLKFTRTVERSDVTDRSGRPREFVAKVGRMHPGCDWCVTDEEVGCFGKD